VNDSGGRTLLQLRVGVFVLAGLLVFAGLVYLLGRQSGLFEHQYRLRAGFAQIGGLIEGATVRLAGVPVGRVTAIRLPEAGDAKVQVELTLVRRVQPRIRADSVARIETLGLLGDKIVEVSLGSPGAAVLPDGAEIRAEDPLDTNRLTQQATDLLRNLEGVSGDVRSAIQKISGSTAGTDLAETLRATRALATEIERGQGLLHRLVYDPKLGKAVGDAADAIRQVSETVRRLDALLADGKTGAMADASATLAETRQAAERVNRVLRQVEEGPGLLHALVYDESRLVHDLEQLLARAQTLVADVEQGQGALGTLLRDPDAARSLRKVVDAAAGLADSVDRARTSDTLLRALLDDPALVADVRETAKSFREVTGRLARGEGLLGSLTTPGSEGLGKDASEGLRGVGRLADRLAGDARFGETLADLQAAMANLRAITARIEAGEGTLGGLVVDPTVYENLAAFLEGAQRSLLLRALIRATAGAAGSGGVRGAGPGTSAPPGGAAPPGPKVP
jgi:phospholipid/cholesterol/gamma-HCH transport system substrate-binding protein